MSYIETLHGPVLRFDLSLTLQFIQSKSAGGEGPWGSYTSKKWSEEPVLSEQNETCYIHMYMQLSTTALIKQRVPIIMIKGLPNS